MKRDLLDDIKQNAESSYLIEFVQTILWSKEHEKGDASMFCMFNDYVYMKDTDNGIEIFDYLGNLILTISECYINNYTIEDYTFNFDAIRELAVSLELIINADKIINI